jgi:hypothetical protein
MDMNTIRRIKIQGKYYVQCMIRCKINGICRIRYHEELCQLRRSPYIATTTGDKTMTGNEFTKNG